MNITRYTPSDWENSLKTKIMHRHRLYDVINENLHCKLIGVIADSGFGKSVLLQGYLSHEMKNTLWCSFDDRDSADTALEEIINTLRDNPEDDIEAIVFDNCSIMSSESTFSSAIPDIADLAPDATMFLIGTSLPRLPFAVMRAKEQYFELTFDDLTLNRAETEMYFNDYLGLSLRTHEIDIIFDKTQGWFISLQLINAYLRKNHLDNMESLDLNFLSDITDINDYFSYNLFENQSQDMQRFLIETSPVIELESDVVNELLGIDNAEDYLAELKEYHGFARITQNRNPAFHPLLRHYLYNRYMSRESASCLDAHDRLVKIYEKKRNYILAFSHAVAGNNYAAAIRLMTRISDRYNPIQILNLIDGHLEEISPALLFSNTSLFLHRCMPDRLIAELVQPLTDAINHEYDSLRLANLQHRLGTTYYQLGNINMAKSLLEKSLTNSEMLRNTEVMAFNYQLLADCHLTMGDITQALRCARNALYLSEQNNIKILQLHTLEVFSRIQLEQGHVDQADDYIDQALELASSDAYELFWLYAALSAVEIARGDSEDAVQHAETAAKIVENSICGYDIAYTQFVLALALISCGKKEDAKAHLTHAYDHSEYNGLLRLEILTAQLEIEKDEARREEILRERADIIEKNGYGDFIKMEAVGNDGSANSGTGSSLGIGTGSGSDADASSSFSTKKSEKTHTSSPGIVINTFDSFSISYNSIPITIKRSSSLRLLQLLVVNRGRFISKSYIIDELFPESSASAGNNNFNVALSVLRKSMDAAAGISSTKESCILRDRDRYQLNMNLVKIDASSFEEKYMKLKKLDSQDLNAWLELSALFNGTFMSDYPYENFIFSERERLTAFQKDVILSIARIYIQKSDFNKSLTYYNQALELDAYDEDVYYEIIEMLLDSGSLVKAQVMAEKMKQNIEAQMGIACSDQLQSMFDYYHKKTSS